MQELDQELLEIEPTSYALYRYDVLRQPKGHKWSKEQLDTIVEQARLGDQEARDLLVLSCVAFVFYRGWRYKDEIRHDDPMDLVSVGNVALMESLDKALFADNPIKYLVSHAAYAITHYVYHYSPMIQRDKHRNLVTPVVSLDQEFGRTELTYSDVVGRADEADLFSESEGTPDEKYAPLYEALGHLTEKQRHVVEKHFGLDGAPEPFPEIGRTMEVDTTTVWKHWKAAQKHLKKLL